MQVSYHNQQITCRPIWHNQLLTSTPIILIPSPFVISSQFILLPTWYQEEVSFFALHLPIYLHVSTPCRFHITLYILPRINNYVCSVCLSSGLIENRSTLFNNVYLCFNQPMRTSQFPLAWEFWSTLPISFIGTCTWIGYAHKAKLVYVYMFSKGSKTA